MRDLVERLQHKDDFPDKDITGQDEPRVDSPPTQGESTATGLPGPDSKEQMDVEPEEWKRVKEKTRPVSPEQSTSALSTQTLMQHHERQKEITMTKEEESMNLSHQSSQLLKTKS